MRSIKIVLLPKRDPDEQIKKNEMGGACGTHERGDVYRLVMGKPEENGPFAKPTSRWENYINIDCQEIGWEGVNWTALAQNGDKWWALVKAVMNLRVP